ncbi:MAG: hypothetical protein JST26_14525 [Bacteroidetes bacterium]|nr:hypothetical protein [Bacteroidota bacterium]
MRFIFPALFVGCIVSFSPMNAQTGGVKAKEQPSNTKEVGRRQFGQATETKQITQVETNGKSFQLDENDPYQGRKEEFLSNLTVKELPADFPKYDKSYGVGGYNTLVDQFYMTHQDILVESVRRKMASMSQQGQQK